MLECANISREKEKRVMQWQPIVLLSKAFQDVVPEYSDIRGALGAFV